MRFAFGLAEYIGIRHDAERLRDDSARLTGASNPGTIALPGNSFSVNEPEGIAQIQSIEVRVQQASSNQDWLRAFNLQVKVLGDLLVH